MDSRLFEQRSVVGDALADDAESIGRGGKSGIHGARVEGREMLEIIGDGLERIALKNEPRGPVGKQRGGDGLKCEVCATGETDEGIERLTRRCGSGCNGDFVGDDLKPGEC